MFRFPLVLVTLHVAMLLALALRAALRRFGRPLDRPPRIARGKHTLLDNTATLLALGHHAGHGVREYFRATMRSLARTYGLPTELSDEDRVKAIADLAKRRGAKGDVLALAAHARALVDRRGDERRALHLLADTASPIDTNPSADDTTRASDDGAAPDTAHGSDVDADGVTFATGASLDTMPIGSLFAVSDTDLTFVGRRDTDTAIVSIPLGGATVTTYAVPHGTVQDLARTANTLNWIDAYTDAGRYGRVFFALRIDGSLQYPTKLSYSLA